MSSRLGVVSLAIVGFAVTGGVSAAAGPSISIVSVSTSGEQANLFTRDASATPDGRYVVFSNEADNLVAPDTRSRVDVFLRDTLAGTTTRITNDALGGPPNGASQSPVISEDGRYVAFASNSTDFVEKPTTGFNIYVYDRQTDEYTLASVSSAGDPANEGGGAYVDMTPDGRYLVFSSGATNLSPYDHNDSSDIYVRDLEREVTRLMSLGVDGRAVGKSRLPQLSSDGRIVVFESGSPRLVADDTNHAVDTFVRDRVAKRTDRISVSGTGRQTNGDSFGSMAISASGRFVAFCSSADNLAGRDDNGMLDVFLHDRETGATKLVSKTPDGDSGALDSLQPFMSLDGRFIIFESYSVLLPDDTNGSNRDVYLWDRPNQQMSLVSQPLSGTQADALSDARGISADGRFAFFVSGANNLTEGDTSLNSDLFVLDRTG